MKEWIVKDTLNNKYVQELVRCKDCKHYNTYECENDYVLNRIKDCGCYPPFWVNPEWYCADGERKDK